jgi:hypothetical protein
MGALDAHRRQDDLAIPCLDVEILGRADSIGDALGQGVIRSSRARRTA